MAFPVTPVYGANLEDIELRLTQLGLEVLDSNGCLRRLVQSQAPIVGSDVIHIVGSTNLANSITQAFAIRAGLIGVCPFSVSCSTSGQNFWAIMNGPAFIRVAASCQPDVPLYTTDTAGVLDDATASLSQNQIYGIQLQIGVSNSSVGNSALQATLNNPLVKNPRLAT